MLHFMKAVQASNPIADNPAQTTAGTVKRHIEVKGDSLLCHRSCVSFEKMDVKDKDVFGSNDCILVYGGYACATLQLRGFGPITRHGKDIQMIATASYLDRSEVAALIEKLLQILPTLA